MDSLGAGLALQDTLLAWLSLVPHTPPSILGTWVEFFLGE